MSPSSGRVALLLQGSGLSLLLIGLLGACDRSTVPPAPKPKAEMSSPVVEPAAQAIALDKLAVDPQVSGDQVRGTPGASDPAAQADPKGELTRQQESTAMPAPGQANDHSNVALDPKSNTKN